MSWLKKAYPIATLATPATPDTHHPTIYSHTMVMSFRAEQPLAGSQGQKSILKNLIVAGMVTAIQVAYITFNDQQMRQEAAHRELTPWEKCANLAGDSLAEECRAAALLQNHTEVDAEESLLEEAPAASSEPSIDEVLRLAEVSADGDMKASLSAAMPSIDTIDVIHTASDSKVETEAA
eukprot:gnl/TRDRNA2_/TRDRNA2_84431_c0_seq1.p1 gnl/TRDRNA2_/TRDRNA2_84431_c0~~gnl/TRDRNA2_/TRDRNA2_84431_c0_seq1.p1  ORF type:complete len:179 (+),score=38.77 gnl/TRDRNA2_/TRDRNA2_84431_c0_seq1:97-633(+)